MDKEFIPYEQALDLKELGFNRRTFAEYSAILNNKWILTFDLSGEGQYPKGSSACIAPTFSQAFRWFREKGYFAQIYPDNSQFVNEAKEWFYSIKNGSITTNDEKYYSYEEAEIECLKKLIEIVKEK
jgi:hypothetical protein